MERLLMISQLRREQDCRVCPSVPGLRCCCFEYGSVQYNTLSVSHVLECRDKLTEGVLGQATTPATGNGKARGYLRRRFQISTRG